MDCLNCKTPNEDAYRFCRECGLPLPDSGTSAAMAAAAVPDSGNPGARIGLALGAVAAGAGILIVCAAGFRATRHHPSRPSMVVKPAAAFVTAPTVQWPAPAPPVPANTAPQAPPASHGMAGPTA